MYYNTKPFAARTKTEQAAIREYIKTAHPSNVPADIDTAEWCFMYHSPRKRTIGQPSDRLIAGI